MQNMIVALIVTGAAFYAAWSLMPGRLRQALARRLLPLAPGQAWLQKAARQTGGCGDGCSSCGDGSPAAGPGAPKTIKVHRRPQA